MLKPKDFPKNMQKSQLPRPKSLLKGEILKEISNQISFLKRYSEKVRVFAGNENNSKFFEVRLNRFSSLLENTILSLQNFMRFVQKSKIPLMENYDCILNIIANHVGHIVDNPFCIEYFK